MARNNFHTVGFLYTPFLIITMSVILGYSAINFLILQRLPRFTDMTASFLLPLIIMSLALLIFYKPTLRLMPKFKGEELRGIVLLSLLSVPGFIVLEQAISQASIIEHSLQIGEELTETTGKHYFSIPYGITIDPTQVGIYENIYNTHNKHGLDDVHFEVYIVAQVQNPKFTKGTLWYGVLYSDLSKHDNSSQDELYERLEVLRTNASKDFNSLINNATFTDLELNTNDEKYANYERAVHSLQPEGNQLVVILKDKEPRKTIGFKVMAGSIVFAVGQFIWLLVCSFVKVSQSYIANLNESNPYRSKQGIINGLKDSFEYLIPRRNYFLTPIIINVNILIFILMYFGQATDPLKAITWGSLFTPSVKHGQVWRILTAGFIHFNFIHILGNMIALGFAGYLLEKVLGTKRFAVLYLISIAGASITSLAYHDIVNAAGASGGVLGLLGAGLIYAIFNIGDQDNRILFVIVFAVFGLFSLVMGFVGHSTDNAGHIGGLLTGMVTGLFSIDVVSKADSIMDD
jgi:rhomboid protease GluP